MSEPRELSGGGGEFVARMRRARARIRVVLGVVAFVWQGMAGVVPAQFGDHYLGGLVFDALTYHSGVLCWKSDCLINEPVARIQRAASGGVDIHTYYQPATCEGLRPRSRNIALDGFRRVYWATGDGRIVMLPQDAVPGTGPTVLAQMENNAATSVHVAVSRDFVYWAESFGELSESGKIFRAPIGGGARSEVVSLTSGGGGGATWLAAATVSTSPLVAPTEVVYYRRAFGPLAKTWLRIVVPWTTDIISPSVQGVTVAEGRIWFAEANAGGASAIRSVPMNNSLTTTLHATVNQAGVPAVPNLAADGLAVYWQEVRDGTGPIMRRYLSGEIPAEAISVHLPTFPYQCGLISDGVHLMWGAGGGVRQTTIRRLPVHAAAVSRNLRADSLEVVQAVQDPEHSVRFVAGKPAWARLLGRIESTTAQETSLAVSACLRGFVDGVELPDSPLGPELGWRRAYRTPQTRSVGDDGWWFSVPGRWMREGLELRATLNPGGGIAETTLADNEVSRALDVEKRQGLAIWMHPVRTHLGVIDRWEPEYQALEDLTEAVLPTHSFNIMFAPGPVIEEWQGPFPWSFGPYELSDADNDSSWVFAKLLYRSALFAIPDLLRTSRVHHGAFFRPAGGQRFLGRGLYYADILVSAIDLGGDRINRPKGALTLAHELAHNFNRRHVDCGDPDDLDAGYPYPPCLIDHDHDESSFAGFNPVTRTFVGPGRVADLMSYAQQVWPSDYTWNALYDDLDDVPSDAIRADGDPPPAAATTGRRLVVFGAIAPDGSAHLEPALPLPDAASVGHFEALLAAVDDDATWQLRLYGAGNTLVGTALVGALPGSESTLLPVFALVDEDDAMQRIELVASAQPGVVLATQAEGGGGAPVVTITAPGAGVVAGEILELRWTVADPDGDATRSVVRYSHDGGDSWRVLAEDLRVGELDVPMAGLPGGPPGSALIEVLATDGLRTGSARSEPFTVPASGPELRIFAETPDQRHCFTPEPVIKPGAPFAIHGRARDAEDGPLPDEALTWSLDGPRSLEDAGRTFLPRRLPPGAYVATLAAEDSDGTVSQRAFPFTIAPLRIEDLAVPPLLDGVPDLRLTPPPGPPVPIPYPNGSMASVGIARNGSFVYVTVTGIPVDPLTLQQIVVSADTDFAGEAAPEADDLRFIAGADGALATERGNGAAWVRDAAPIGLAARTTSNDGFWHAELRISLSRLGAWDGRSIRLDVAVDGRHWFDGVPADALVPGRWAVVELAADTDPTFDGDGDGIPDAWESLHLAGTERDGAGDLDGDGQSDAEEYQAGTDPASAASRFEVTGGPAGEETIELRWDSRVGHCYDVEVSIDLVHFTAVATDIPGTGEESSWSIALPADLDVDRILYRVRARRVAP